MDREDVQPKTPLALNSMGGEMKKKKERRRTTPRIPSEQPHQVKNNCYTDNMLSCTRGTSFPCAHLAIKYHWIKCRFWSVYLLSEGQSKTFKMFVSKHNLQ